MPDEFHTLEPEYKDGAVQTLKKILKGFVDGGFSISDSGGGGGSGGGEYVPTTGALVTVTTTAAQALAASATARYIRLNNNGTETVTFIEGSGTPVADSGGTAGPFAGNGYGIQIPPGAFYESPLAIKSAIRAVVQANTGKLTITESAPA